VAVFGNPNVDFTRDWIPTIVADASNAIKKPGSVDNILKSCTLVSALEVEVLTSEVGYVENLQKYVIGAKVTPVSQLWIFDEANAASATPQQFSLQVSIAFNEIKTKDLDRTNYVSFQGIKGNLFYPFNMKAGATSLIFGAASLLFTVLSLS